MSEDIDQADLSPVIYSQPLVIGALEINNSNEYQAQRTWILGAFAKMGFDDTEISEFDANLGQSGSVEAADDSIDYITIMGDSTVVSGGQDLSSLVASAGNTDELVSFAESDTMDPLAEMAAQFSLDSTEPHADTDSAIMKEYVPQCQEYCIMSLGIGPPRPHMFINDPGEPKFIIFTRSWSPRSFRLKRQGKWSDVCRDHIIDDIRLPEESHFDPISRRRESDATLDLLSSSSLSQLTESYDTETRSNTRPKGSIVYIEMEDGQMVNVGTHTIRLRKDIKLSLDTSSGNIALAEYFSAVAGEGLSCATPSHELHQVCSALLSEAIDMGADAQEVKCEQGRNDIQCILSGTHDPIINIDITSTGGIWKKPLRRYHMAALSKYDIATCFCHLKDETVNQVVAASILNCLATEHPAYYGLPVMDDLPIDLQLQYRISDRLHKLSQTTMQELCQMSHEALLSESVNEALGQNVIEQGRTYREKADILLNKILSLKCKDNYAIPPIPCGKISRIGKGPGRIDVCGQDIVFPDINVSDLFENSAFTVDDYNFFLQHYPVVGRCSSDEAKEIAHKLNSGFATISGDSHRGPLPDVDTDTHASDLWHSVGNIYQQSSIAQYAEIRADLIKACDLFPAPGPRQFRMRPLYNNKVLCWYACRDHVTSGKGYRLDWFALSEFPVIGGIKVEVNPGHNMYLWPRQRIRSQEMEMASMLPRRLKLCLFSMLEKASTTHAKIEDIIMAWQRLGLTAIASTWASGSNFITCRHLSASFSAPSPPFDAMAKKFKPPQTLACLLYFDRLIDILSDWKRRDQYRDVCPILGLPRSFIQLESYWQVWVPDEMADTGKHLLDCVIALHDEYSLLEDTFEERYADILEQYSLIMKPRVSITEMRESISASMSLNTGGKLGWNVFGSLASAYALSKQGDVSQFDRAFSRGVKARRLVDHLTVRHSARLDGRKQVQKGTVAANILLSGIDNYLSSVRPTLRFYYGSAPIFFNHPKNGEHKDREISITDPDSRIMLNNAELICGKFGTYTVVDLLKNPNKDAYFYRKASDALIQGGVIQASDASRFSAMMSNIATGLMTYGLSAIGGSSHLASSASTYRRLASRRMAIDSSIMEQIDKRLNENRETSELKELRRLRKWYLACKKIGEQDGKTLRAYTTSVHTGQGMSHHGTSLAHGGALSISLEAAAQAEIRIRGVLVSVSGTPMVTSDDSTIVAMVDDDHTGAKLSRAQKQRACHMFLRIQRKTRSIALRSVSVMPNLSKEKISGVCGEFNSQDTGIGNACPILGFREMITQLVRPSSGSLMQDYLSAKAYSQNIALSGQGITTGIYAHRLMIDAVESRWRLKKSELTFLATSRLFSDDLLHGTDPENIMKSPASMLPHSIRARLIEMSRQQAQAKIDLDPHTQDTVYGPLLHIKVGMKKQHEDSLQLLRKRIDILRSEGLIHQAEMLDQCLVAVMSSARTRNTGRIGQRIRTRQVKPSDYAGKHFTKGPMLETTLQWFDYIDGHLDALSPSPESLAQSKELGAYLTVTKSTRFKYPEPPLILRSKGVIAVKPTFILDTYGTTPFGRHVIERSQAHVVKEVGAIERQMVHEYLSSLRYNRVPGHITYGRTMISGWATRVAGSLTPVNMPIGTSTLVPKGIKWGIMDDDALTFLRDTEDNYPGMPILSVNYAFGNVIHFHGIYKGNPFSHSYTTDIDSLPIYSVIPCLVHGSVSAILAYQGCTLSKEWYGNGPTGQEIRRFQRLPKGNIDHYDTQSLCMEIAREGGLSVPAVAALITRDSQTVLFSAETKINLNAGPKLLPYERSKIVGTAAMGGYWYTHRKGVSFRAFLKGHCGRDNSWTSAVLGWRSSLDAKPRYYWEPPGGGDVKYIAMIGGIDTCDDIAQVNRTPTASGSYYVDHSGLHMVSRRYEYELNAEVMLLIRTLNGGNNFFNKMNREAELIDTLLPEKEKFTSTFTAEEAEARLLTIATGDEDMESLFD